MEDAERPIAAGTLTLEEVAAETSLRPRSLVEYIGHLNSVNQTLYNRELAVFYADHDMKLPQALDSV